MKNKKIKWPEKGKLRTCMDFSKYNGNWESVKTIYGIFDDNKNLLLELTKEQSCSIPLRFYDNVIPVQDREAVKQYLWEKANNFVKGSKTCDEKKH